MSNRVATASARRSEAGYSLIEVLAAAAILAGVLIAIMTMFVYGGRSVNSGKVMTKATSIASDVLEEFREFGFTQAYLVIEDGGAPATDTRYVWNSATDLPNYPADLSYQAMLTDWKNQVTQGLPAGEMTITVRGISELGADPDELNFNQARLLQVVVTVRWREARRNRSVVFQTLKT